MMATIKITRLESYPSEKPVGNCVGFTVTCNNGQSFYVDTVINYERASGTNEAIEFALQDLKSGINTRVSALEAVEPLFGSNVSLPDTDLIQKFESDESDESLTIVYSDTKFDDGDQVVIEGCGESSYNGTHDVTVIESGISFKIPVVFVSSPDEKGTSKKYVLEV